MTIKAQTDAYDLWPSELDLVAQYPEIRWLEPAPVTFGKVTTLTCQFCTYFHGFSAADVLYGTVGFADREEHRAHLKAVHAR